MSDTIVTPLSAWPQTEAYKTPAGLNAYRVIPSVLTPERARACNSATETLRLALLVLFGYGFWIFHSAAFWWAHALIWFGLFVLVERLVERHIARFYRRVTVIEMTTEHVGVQRGKSWVWYSRAIEHRFIAPRHDNAREEERKNDVARQAASIDRQVARGSFYYTDSFHVALELAGHRHDLLTVYGPQEASAILARLQYLDRLLDAAIKKGHGVPQGASDQWHETPGDVS